MTTLGADVAVKVSTEAAQNFIDSYYLAIQDTRQTLATFYMPPTTMPDGKPLPVIVYNGNIIPDPKSMQTLFQEEMPETRYEVQSYDAQVLNPHYVAEGTKETAKPSSGKSMTILVAVSGYVKYGEPRGATMRGFSENFILIPNPAMAERASRSRNTKEWLIQSQTFRLVV